MQKLTALRKLKIIRSKRRRRTVSARIIKDALVVSAPENISEERLQEIIASLKEKIERKQLNEELNKEKNLIKRAQALNAQYFENKLKVNSIEYVTVQTSKFGCCNYQRGSIRISHRVSEMPRWVRDYIILHELAHLRVPNHSKAFWDIVNCYKLTERARGYLIAVGLETAVDDNE